VNHRLLSPSCGASRANGLALFICWGALHFGEHPGAFSVLSERSLVFLIDGSIRDGTHVGNTGVGDCFGAPHLVEY
jgi:hypothetical protein